jgi:hypothetical protein
MLVEAGSSELLIQDYDCLQCYRGPEDSFSYLLQQCFPPVDQWSMRDRLSVASSLGETWWPNSVNLIQMVLKPAKLGEIARARPPNSNLLHLCMDRYRYRRDAEVGVLLLRRLEDPGDPWRTLTRELVMAGEYVSTLSQKTRMSPLGELMNSNRLRFADLLKAVKTWLQDLKDAGVDLEEYGKEEMSLSKSYSDRPLPIYDFYKDGTLMRFASYGPAVEDWGFYALEPSDRFAVEKQTRFGVDSRAELDFSGTNTPDWSDASDWSDSLGTEPELSELNIPGSWATFDDEND